MFTHFPLLFVFKMRYQLSEIEEVEAQRQAKERQSASGRISMNRTDLQVSGSSWNALHLKAFRVVNIDNCPLSRLFSTNHIPNDADKGRSTQKP